MLHMMPTSCQKWPYRLEGLLQGMRAPMMADVCDTQYPVILLLKCSRLYACFTRGTQRSKQSDAKKPVSES